MKRRTLTLGFVAVSSASLAGCAGLNPFTDADDSSTSGGVQSSSETDSEAAGEDSDGTDTDSETEPSEGSSDFDADTDTDSIVLRLSDLGAEYEYSGERDIVTAELEGDEQEQYASDHIIRQHSRSFQRSSDADSPTIIYSEVTVYETADDEDSQFNDIISTFEEQSSNITNINIAADVTTTQIKYENDRDAQNILLYYQQDNLRLLVITSDPDSFYSERAKQLMITMISDIP